MPSRPAMVLTTMCVGMFLVLLDVTVVNVALPSIAAGLGADAVAVQWVVDAYAVTIATLLLAGGTIGDRVGHRRVVLVGLALFGIASAGCALAPTSGALIAARAVQGAGAALLLPGSVAVIADAYPDRGDRARALGTWAAVSSLALPAGPLVGSLLVSVGSWRLTFWINIPVVAAALVAIPALVAAGAPHPGRHIDVAGIALAAITLGAAVFTVIEIGHHGLDAVAIATMTAAAGAGVGFVLREQRAADPMIPLDLLRRPSVAGPTVAAATMNLVLNGSLFVATLFLQNVQHRSVLEAGAALLPMAVPLVVLSPVAGHLTARFGPRLPLMAGATVAAFGVAAFAFVEPGSSYLVLLVPLLGLGIGGGLFTAPVVTATVSAVPLQRSGLASGLSNTARQTGTALGVAIFGSVASATALPMQFVAGLHMLAGIGTMLWLAVLVMVGCTIERPLDRSRTHTG